MKHFFTFRKIAIFIIVVAIVAGGLLFYGFKHPQKENPASVPVSNANCMESSRYFVVDNNPGLPGLDVVAKHKTSPDETIPCAGGAEAGDVVIQNDLPEFVLGLAENFLIIDSGTAPPPRGLELYDLDAQTSTYTDQYSDPISIASDSITYWEPIRRAVTLKNCPDFDQYTADGLGAVIESHITLNLPALTKEDLGESRCVPTQ